jgi:hypothetical protein
MPAKADLLDRTRAQRIPFRPGLSYPNRGPDTLAQTNLSTLIFCLQQDGGPYMQSRRSFICNFDRVLAS